MAKLRSKAGLLNRFTSCDVDAILSVVDAPRYLIPDTYEKIVKFRESKLRTEVIGPMTY